MTRTRTASNYSKVDKPLDARDAVERLEAISEAAQVAGITLPAAIEDGATMIERCRRWKVEAGSMVEDRADATRRITHQLVAGDISMDDALAEAARVEATATGGVFARAVNMTETLAAKRAFEEIGSEIDGEAILTEARKVCETTVAEIRKLRKALDGITSDAEATAAGPRSARAWSQYRVELLPRFSASHELVALLRALHWIEPLPVELSAHVYARPDVIREARLDAKRAGKAWLPILNPADDAAQPGGPFRAEELRAFDAEAAEADHKAEDVRQEVAERLGRIPVSQR
jgi:hypothetical protein